LDTFSSVRRPKNSGVIWKKKGSSNTFNVYLSAVSVLNLNKNVKRYSRKDLLACNNSHLGETSGAYMCNDVMTVSCDFRMCDLLDDNNFFIFDDESVKISPVSKMPFRKKPCDSMNVRSKSNMIKSLPRTIIQICLWIIDSGCSKHMTGNRALLMNFVEKFLETVRFGNNDFAVIAGYGDVVIGSMALKSPFESLHALFETKMGLPKMKFEKDHLCSACKQGKIHREHHKSKTAFASNKPLYLLHMDLCGPMRVQRESSSSLLNDDVQQIPEEVNLPQTNTQSISNNMIPTVDEASTSHNVFNDRLEDAYFDASTSFHDPSNVHTYY
nr:ribonuclease H-like domain-containing protein [Tanacetum cinerariifolium]